MAVDAKGSKREQLRLAREKQAKEAKIRKIIGLALAGVVAVGLVVAGVLVIKNKPSSTPVAAGAPKYLTSDGSFRVLPSGGVDTKADDSAKKGKTRVEMIFDPQCPGCGAVSRALDAHLLDLVKKGEIDLYMKPVAFLDQASSDKYSSRAASAVLTVASEDPKHFFAFASIIYDSKNQPHEGTEYVPVSDEKLGEIARGVGVPKSVTDKFKDNTYQSWVMKETTRTMARSDLFPGGSFSTPAVFVGGTVKDGKVSDATRVKFDTQTPIVDAFDKVLAENKKGN